MVKRPHPTSTARSARSRTAKKAKRPASPMLDRLQPDELARVLRAMLANHPELHDEAEALAAELLSEVSPASVAPAVRDVTMARLASAAAELAPEWESAIGREADRR